MLCKCCGVCVDPAILEILAPMVLIAVGAIYLAVDEVRRR